MRYTPSQLIVKLLGVIFSFVLFVTGALTFPVCWLTLIWCFWMFFLGLKCFIQFLRMVEYNDYETMSRNDIWFRCPECNKFLLRSLDKRVYEDLCDHIECRENIEPRDYLYCGNNNCLMNIRGYFWDLFGDFYSSRDGVDYYNKHHIDSHNPKTWKNHGVAAINSPSWLNTRQTLRAEKRLKKRLIRWLGITYSLSDKGVELRRQHDSIRYDYVPSFKHRFWYSVGTWLLDPSGSFYFRQCRHYKKFGGNGRSVKNGIHHPYPWVSLWCKYALKRG